MRYHTLTQELIQRSGAKARELGHSYVGSVHILLALCREPGLAGQVLRILGVDPEMTESMAQLLYGTGTRNLPLPQGLTQDAKQLLAQAAEEAKDRRSHVVKPYHLLLALARQAHCPAGELLEINGVSADALFTHTVDYLRWTQAATVKPKKEAVATRLLEHFSEDLVARATTMDPVIGRDDEIRNVIRELGKNHTVILSSHILQEVNAICERVIIINKGRLMASDTPDNLAKSISNANCCRFRAVFVSRISSDAYSLAPSAAQISAHARFPESTVEINGTPITSRVRISYQL